MLTYAVYQLRGLIAGSRALIHWLDILKGPELCSRLYVLHKILLMCAGQ